MCNVTFHLFISAKLRKGKEVRRHSKPEPERPTSVVGTGPHKVVDKVVASIGSEKVADARDKVADARDKVANTGTEVRLADTGDKVADAGTEVADTGDKVADTGDKVTDTGDKVADTGDKVASIGDNKDTEDNSKGTMSESDLSGLQVDLTLCGSSHGTTTIDNLNQPKQTASWQPRKMKTGRYE